ncbi:hypothetical protein D3C71_221370 [compost metagenome]
MIPLSILNPWVLLGLLVGFSAVGGLGYVAGSERGAEGVQVRWDRAELKRTQDGLREAERVRESSDQLQAKADEERKTNAALLTDINRRLQLVHGELSKRPQRPDVSAPAAVAGLGAGGWATGAGLYRDDGLFLAGKAALWQQIRMQRDTCYRQYEKAQFALEALKKEKP